MGLKDHVAVILAIEENNNNCLFCVLYIFQNVYPFNFSVSCAICSFTVGCCMTTCDRVRGMHGKSIYSYCKNKKNKICGGVVSN